MENAGTNTEHSTDNSELPSGATLGGWGELENFCQYTLASLLAPARIYSVRFAEVLALGRPPHAPRPRLRILESKEATFLSHPPHHPFLRYPHLREPLS